MRIMIKNVKPPLTVEEIMKLAEENNKLKLAKPIGKYNKREKDKYDID